MRSLHSVWCVVAIALAVVATVSVGQADDQRPNVVLILADDFGRELLPIYGGASYKTPALDQLSADGLTFETCYATPLCAPSRVELITSQYSFRSYESWGEIDRNADTFVRRVREAGYQTFLAGKWHMSGWDKQPLGVRVAGFERHCSYDYAAMLAGSFEGDGNRFWGGQIIEDGQTKQLDRYGDDVFTDYLCDRIRGRDPQRPFFAFLPLNLLHRPFHPPPPTDSGGKIDGPIPDEWLGPVGEAENFPAMVAYTDHLVQRICDLLDDLELGDNTLLIFTADNGTDNVHEAKTVRSAYREREVAGGKYFPTELGLNVPLLIRWPATVEAGRRTAALVDFTDLGATICDLAGASQVNDTDGRTLGPLLTGDVDHHKDMLFSWGNYERSSRRYKAPAENQEKLFDVIRGPRWKWVSRGQIYDLESDGFEERPVPPAKSRAQRKKMKSFRDELRNSDPKRW